MHASDSPVLCSLVPIFFVPFSNNCRLVHNNFSRLNLIFSFKKQKKSIKSANVWHTISNKNQSLLHIYKYSMIIILMFLYSNVAKIKNILLNKTKINLFACVQ